MARSLDFIVYGGALCCDATVVSPLTRTGHPQPCTVEVDAAMLKVAERRERSTYPELAWGMAPPLYMVFIGGGDPWSGQ